MIQHNPYQTSRPVTEPEDFFGRKADLHLIYEMLRCGERGWNLKRAINIRLGLTRENDKLPKALLEPYREGGAEGYVIPFDEMIKAYYAARGRDPGTGRPTKAKLKFLGLGNVAKDLWG